MVTRLRWISSVTLVLVLMAGLLALASGPQAVSAQRDRATRTPRSGEGGQQGGALQATLTAVAGSANGVLATAQAALTNLPNTADGLLATAQAAMRPHRSGGWNPGKGNAWHGVDHLVGRALMITTAWASGGSSVKLTSIWAIMPGGVIAASRAAAPPVRARDGLPPGRLTTPMSRQNTPERKPVPSALAQASLAA